MHFTQIISDPEELHKFGTHYHFVDEKNKYFCTLNLFSHLISLQYFHFAPKQKDHKGKDGKFHLSFKGLKAQKKKKPPDSTGKYSTKQNANKV